MHLNATMKESRLDLRNKILESIIQDLWHTVFLRFLNCLRYLKSFF